jgi:hypothetical protein
MGCSGKTRRRGEGYERLELLRILRKGEACVLSSLFSATRGDCRMRGVMAGSGNFSLSPHGGWTERLLFAGLPLA